MAGKAQTGMGKRRTADLADWFRHMADLLLAIRTPAESCSITPSTDWWEQPVHAIP
ncbi:MAG: hypothetical protein WCE68_09780 [Anaerolineales bacterium]